MLNINNFRAMALPLALVAGLVLPAAVAADDDTAAGFYTVRKLVADTPGVAEHTDPNLVNAWGVAHTPSSPTWVANNGTGHSTLYDGNGVAQPVASPLVVTIPGVGGEPGRPTGMVFNGTTDFVIPNTTGVARFIFATEDGTIAGWAPTVNLTTAIVAVPNTTGAIYKGLAIGANASGNFLYAADFHNGRVAVFDNAFQPATLAGDFTDPHLPSGYAPFGIQNLGGSIYVSYAKQDADAEDEIDGQGLGLVDEFDANGNFKRRVASHGQLNAPWGMAVAPTNFGPFSGTLLVGNFGDGRINAFDLKSGELLGPLRGKDGKRIVIDGLWGITFGNDHLNQPSNVLFFASGPDGENHGLYGRIDASGP